MNIYLYFLIINYYYFKIDLIFIYVNKSKRQ